MNPNESGNPAGRMDLPLRPEQKAAFLRYIYAGGNLIKTGRYQDAIIHFEKDDELKRVGFGFSIGRSRFINAEPKPEEIPSIANIIAMNSWCWENQKTVVVSRAKGLPGLRLPDQLLHEISLVHMEEWLHALQCVSEKPLAGYVDREIDVAAYMQKTGIPLTAAFLNRYDRGLLLTGLEGEDDSSLAMPALRRGVFVRVNRSDGTVDDSWQIAAFHPRTGEVIVLKRETPGSTTYSEKKLSPQELADMNETGTHPFEQATDFGTLYYRINELGFVLGTIKQEYNAPDLINLINMVRRGEEQLTKVPRSGGLRQKVGSLLPPSQQPVSSKVLNIRTRPR